MTTHPIPLPDSDFRAHGRGDSARLKARSLPDLTKLRRVTSEQAGVRNELAWLLVLDNLIDAGEAENRWLDHVGTRLGRGATRPPSGRTRDTAGARDEDSTESATR